MTMWPAVATARRSCCGVSPSSDVTCARGGKGDVVGCGVVCRVVVWCREVWRGVEGDVVCCGVACTPPWCISVQSEAGRAPGQQGAVGRCGVERCGELFIPQCGASYPSPGVAPGSVMVCCGVPRANRATWCGVEMCGEVCVPPARCVAARSPAGAPG
jgi:hypothetical protein